CLAIAIWRRRTLLHVAIAAALFIGANLALVHWQQKFGEVRSMTGRQLFFSMYLHSDGVAASGPYGAQLRRWLAEFVRNAEAKDHDLRSLGGPPVSDDDFRLLYRPYAGRPDQLVDAMFRHPGTQYFWTMFMAAEAMKSEHPDRLFLGAAIEH